MIDFAGRWIVVSGASSGLGQAIALELARHGAKLALIGRDIDRLGATAAQLGGAEHRTITLDLRNTSEIGAAMGALRQDVGVLYGMCHAAGVVQTRPLPSSDAEVLRGQMEVNVTAGLELARAVCRRDTIDAAGGSVLFLSSVYGRAGMPGQIAYSATKGAIVAAARSMAIELARRNVRVNCLSPGFVATEMTKKALDVLTQEQSQKIKSAHPLGIGQPEDVARAAAFVLSPAARWITGADIPVDGGYTAQ